MEPSHKACFIRAQWVKIVTSPVRGLARPPQDHRDERGEPKQDEQIQQQIVMFHEALLRGAGSASL